MRASRLLSWLRTIKRRGDAVDAASVEFFGSLPLAEPRQVPRRAAPSPPTLPRPRGGGAAALCLLLAACSSGSDHEPFTGATQGWPQVPPAAFPAAVDRVIDGDTIVARKQGKRLRVRLIGIDAPESVQPDAPVECFGLESARALAKLLPPGTRLMAAYQGMPEHDQYGRELWDVWVDGRFLQAELVSRGVARARVYRPQTQYADLLEQLGASARQAGAGLFAACPASTASSVGVPHPA